MHETDAVELAVENKNHTEPLFQEVLEHTPKLVSLFMPSDKTEQKEAFLSGEIVNPAHHYDKLDALNVPDEKAAIMRITSEIAIDPGLNPKFLPAYQAFANKSLNQLAMLEAAQAYNHAQSSDEKRAAADTFMRYNSETYGAPEEDTYRALLRQNLQKIQPENLSSEATAALEQLRQLCGTIDTEAITEAFTPSPETVAWAHQAVTTLFGGLLRHVEEDPEGERRYSPQEIQAVFQEILTDEFSSITDEGEVVNAAEGWTVVIEPAQSIHVEPTSQQIIIPESRKPVSTETLRHLIVHEIGVHALSAMIGASTDLAILGRGLENYYDSEEGLGTVAEQALDGVYEAPSPAYYLAAGLAYFDHKDFRGTYETLWRMDALTNEVDFSDQKAIERVQTTAYNHVMRIMRGTDRLPWFKDLAYYNGKMDVWKYLEAHRGDVDAIHHLFGFGKIDRTSQEDERLVYETASF